MAIPFQIWRTADGLVKSGDTETVSATQLCHELESSAVIYFPRSPFIPAEDDIDFLLRQKQLESAYHKNIAYRPLSDKLTGVHATSKEDRERLRDILSRYTTDVGRFLNSFLSPYQGALNLDYASFRPIEERGRQLRLRAQNNLVHVDSFPTRATYGNRIFRVFTNINPTEPRVWNTSRPFPDLVRHFKSQMRPYQPDAVEKKPSRFASKIFKALGLTDPGRPSYDRWMLDFHNFLKENSEFQASGPKDRWEFPPGSAWMVYTDCTSHAVLSGQYALEQTYMIDQSAMVSPHLAPKEMLANIYLEKHDKPKLQLVK